MISGVGSEHFEVCLHGVSTEEVRLVVLSPLIAVTSQVRWTPARNRGELSEQISSLPYISLLQNVVNVIDDR